MIDMCRNRWNNHTGNARNFERGTLACKAFLYEHFILPGHSGFLQDVPVTLTGKIDPSCPIKPGNYWIDTLKTKTTHRNES